MALEIGAEYLELANTQYYGWADLNRGQLMPTREQLERAEAVVAQLSRDASATAAHLVRRARTTTRRGRSAA